MSKPKHVTHISSDPDGFKQYLNKIFKARVLVLTLSFRSIKIKYSQTALGVAWSLIQPLTALAIFSLFFNYIISFDDMQWPYAVYAFSGIVVWNYFSYVFSQGSTALREGAGLIQKFNFPKIVLVLSKFLVGLVEMGMSLMIAIGILIWMKTPISLNIIFLPFIIALTGIIGLGLALIVAASTYRIRDAFHIVPYLVNFGIWFTPVFFPINILPELFQKSMWFNPLAGCITLFRWSLLGGSTPDWQYVYGVVIGLLLFVIGFVYMKKTEDKIVDYL